MKPLLKWAGGKYRILDRIKEILPPGTRLIEPFLGSGAVFLNTDYPEYFLADSNPDLINLYHVLQAQGPDFINYCRSFFTPESNREEVYYKLRAEFNQSTDRYRKAAIFLYLNRHSYNGLCRYNSSGDFNTPFGRYTRPYFPEKEMLHCWRKSAHAVFACQDFDQTMSHLRPGDVVYCDPPYVPLSSTANFTSYSSENFGLKEQERLARAAFQAAAQGIPVLLSNNDTPLIRNIYQQASISSFEVRRFISCDGSRRGKANEVLILLTQ